MIVFVRLIPGWVLALEPDFLERDAGHVPD